MRILQHVRFLLAAAGLSFLAMSASASPANPQAGKDYRVMSTPQSTDSGKKVEVTEFFSYMCPHCAVFDAPLTEWVKKQGDRIVFKRVPISFRDSWVAQQKAYYTIEAMGKTEELHSKIFNGIHQQHQLFETDAAVADFMVKQGIDKTKFSELYTSFGVQSRVRRAAQLQDSYQVDSVPTVAIDGRFVTSAAMVGVEAKALNEAGLQAATMEVMDFLVAKAYKEKNGATADVKPAVEPAPSKAAAKAKATPKAASKEIAK